MKTILLIEPGNEPVLRANGLTDFGAFMRRAPSAPATSRHWNRETVPLDLNVRGQARRYYLKRLFRVQPEHVIAALARLKAPTTQPLDEWRNVQLLQSAGIGCMNRVAAGQRALAGIPRQAFLLVEAVPARFTVAEWLGSAVGCDRRIAPSPCPGEGRGDGPPLTPLNIPNWMKRRLALELGRFARRLDDAGLDWPDIHPKHIFARPHPAGRKGRRWQFFLIDVERLVRRSASPGALTAATTLAQLLDATAGRTGPKQPGRWHGWIHYGALFDARPAGRARRITTIPAPAAVTRANGLVIDRRRRSILRNHGLDSYRQLLACDGGTRLDKPGLQPWRRRDRIEIRDDDGVETTFYLKRYHRPPWRHQIRRMAAGHARHSSAGVERHAINTLAETGIPGPRWAAFGEDMHGWVEHGSLLLLEQVPGRSLERYVQTLARDPSTAPAPAIRCDIVRRLARLVRHIHDHGLFHRDLYLAHVFLQIENGRPVLRLIDVARMIRRRRRQFRWRVKDLAALDYSSPPAVVTRTDRLRFLRTYCSILPSPLLRPNSTPARTGPSPARLAQRLWVRAIARRTARMARRDARHGRAATLSRDAK